jgi:hypothetical protein
MVGEYWIQKYVEGIGHVLTRYCGICLVKLTKITKALSRYQEFGLCWNRASPEYTRYPYIDVLGTQALKGSGVPKGGGSLNPPEISKFLQSWVKFPVTSVTA